MTGSASGSYNPLELLLIPSGLQNLSLAMLERWSCFARALAAGSLATALSAGGAFAQERPSPAVAPQETAVEAPENAVKAEVFSDHEKLSRSAAHLTQMRQGLKVVLTKLEEARASKDVVKLNCVNEKLTNIKGLLRISEQADVSLQEAVAKGEEQGAGHEFAKVTIARQKIDQLKAEAEGCVGLLAFETGPTEVIVEEPLDLPALDPTKTVPPPPVVSRPLPASPTG